MEGKTTIEEAKKIFGKWFIGPDELSLVSAKLGIIDPLTYYRRIPDIPFDKAFLNKNKENYIMLLGVPDFYDGTPISLKKMRSYFGLDTDREPCFYNQDWYLHEPFFNNSLIELKWYLIRKELVSSTRGQSLHSVDQDIVSALPSALLCAFAFFSCYFVCNHILWEFDYVWCSDVDSNGDQIYVARYFDPVGISKNGFSIHRHLSIRKNYGCIDIL